MSAKKPNILECDGLIIRGRDGEMRAEISVDDDARVLFYLYGEGTSPPEPAFCAEVSRDGRTCLSVDYVGLDELGSADVYGGVKLTSGDPDKPPRFAVWGRGIEDHIPIYEFPERSRDGIRQDLLNQIYALVHRHAKEHDLDVKQVASILESADFAYRAGGKT